MNPVLHGFADELEKLAIPGFVGTAGRFLSQSPGRTALLGAGLGAGVGAARGALNEEPGYRGLGALKGGVLGAAAGGAIGGIGGGLGRAYRDTGLLNRAAGISKGVGGTAADTARRAGRGIVDFGKRQLHGVSGAFTKDLEADSLILDKGLHRSGNFGMQSSGVAADKAHLLEQRFQDRLKDFAPGSKAETRLREAHDAAKKGLKEWGERGDTNIKAGITSLPGTVRGLVTKPGETAKALYHATTGGAGTKGWGRVAGIGMAAAPAALAAPGIIKGDESASGGLTRGQKIVRAGAATGGMLLTGGMGIIPQMAVGGGLDSLASRLTKPKHPELAQNPGAAPALNPGAAQ